MYVCILCWSLAIGNFLKVQTLLIPLLNHAPIGNLPVELQTLSSWNVINSAQKHYTLPYLKHFLFPSWGSLCGHIEANLSLKTLWMKFTNSESNLPQCITMVWCDITMGWNTTSNCFVYKSDIIPIFGVL